VANIANKIQKLHKKKEKLMKNNIFIAFFSLLTLKINKSCVIE